MIRFLLAALAALLLGVAPASANTETTTTLTFNSKGAIVDNFATVFGGPTGAPAFTIYGRPDITPGSTRVGAVSTPGSTLDAYFFLGLTPPAAGTGFGNSSLAPTRASPGKASLLCSLFTIRHP